MSTTLPSKENIDRNNTLSKNESYYQYRVSIRPEDMVIGKNFITDIVEGEAIVKNGDERHINWYQFKIPIRNPERTIGSIQDFNSIRFMRMFLHGFDKKLCFDLLRSDW